MIIEILSKNNINALIKLVLEIWQDCTFDEELENYKGIIDSSNEVCFLSKIEKSYIGFVHVSIRHDYVEGAEESPIAYLESIYAKPAFQKKGVAKKLLHAVEDWAKLKGFNQIASDTEIKNSVSIDFHSKNGFSEMERIVCFIKNLS